MTLTLKCRQPKILYFDFLAKAPKCHFQDALDEWKISIFKTEAEKCFTLAVLMEKS
jgi:hypothetical protein